MMSRKGSLFHHLRSDESKHIRQLVRNRVLNARDHESNIFEKIFLHFKHIRTVQTCFDKRFI